jgi:uncharacterized membrane protein YdjX (TVP38/TMEM64 family)
LVILVLILAFASGLTRRLSLHEVHENRVLLLSYVRAHPVLCLGAYVGLYASMVALSLPAALVMTLTGGLLFGPWVGGVSAALSCTLGAAVIFLVCRTAIGDALRGRAGSLVGRIEQGVADDAFAYVAALRLIPVAPFWLANLALGFVDIPLPTFVAATFVGILPVSLVFAGIGSSLNAVFAKGGGGDLHALLRPAALLPLAGLGLLALAPIIVRRLRGSR